MFIYVHVFTVTELQGNNATGRLGVNGVFVIYASRIATTSKLGENAAGKNYYFSLHLLFFMCFDNAFSKSLGFALWRLRLQTH